jgi:osmotically inducible protein OsmC
VPRIERVAEAVWQGRSASGSGVISGRSSGAFDLAYSEPTRVADPAGQSSPEELIAAAHAGCFSMALSAELGKANVTAKRIETTAKVTLEPVDGAPTVTKSELFLTVSAPGASQGAIEKAANDAKAGCPISRLLNTRISLAMTVNV